MTNKEGDTMNRENIEKFLAELEKLNRRDALIARIIWETGLRREAVINLTPDNVRMKGIEIDGELYELSEELSKELRGYVKFLGTEGCIFLTSKGKPVDRRQLVRAFSEASERSGIKITVKMLERLNHDL